MDLKVAITQFDDYVIVALHGKIDLTYYDLFLKKLSNALLTNKPNVVMDFTSVLSISSVGISAVVEANQYTVGHGGKLILIGLNRMIHQIFELTGVLNLLEVSDTLEEAIALIHLEPSLL